MIVEFLLHQDDGKHLIPNMTAKPTVIEKGKNRTNNSQQPNFHPIQRMMNEEVLSCLEYLSNRLTKNSD